MESPFEKASSIKPRLKLMIYGESGVGKTTLSLSFPKPVLIDMEGGADLYGGSFDFGVLKTSTPDEVSEAVGFLKHEAHDYRTLVVDPITIFWESLQKKWSDIYLKRNTGTKAHKHEFYDLQPRDWMTIKAEYNELMKDLIALDMNVIITAREKTLYQDNAFMVKAGRTYDGEKHTDYNFDTVIRLFIEGGKYMAMRQKDRSNKLPDEPFEISYAAMEKLIGKAVLDRKPVPVLYATPEQKKSIEAFIKELGITKKGVDVALKNYGATCLDDLSQVNAGAIIEKLTKAKAEGGTNADS